MFVIVRRTGSWAANCHERIATMPAQQQKLKQESNIDPKTVKGFGEEWSAFTQAPMADAERLELFNGYFSLIDGSRRPKHVMDFGCGSGRWSLMVAPRVDRLVAVD